MICGQLQWLSKVVEATILRLLDSGHLEKLIYSKLLNLKIKFYITIKLRSNYITVVT